LVFERLWQQLGLPEIVTRLLAGRRFGFSVERAVFLTVLHRLFPGGRIIVREAGRRMD